MKDKKIKVYLQYPWKNSDSQYYKSLMDNPPGGIEYITDNKKVGMIVNKNLFKTRTFLKKYLSKFLRASRISIINLHETKTKEKYDITHCAHCLSKNDSPWVADFEGFWQMWISGTRSKKSHEKIRKILLRNNCKKIIAWTETVKKEIIKKFPEIKEKIEIIPYAIPPQDIKKKKKTNKITLLSISRYFYEKGGLHTLEVFDRLTKKYKNVEAIFVSSTPKKIIDKYEQNEKIKFYDLIPHKEIIENIFPSADIFVYPGYSDSFGFIFVESLAFGLPVVTVDGFARKDIIENGRTGYILEKPKDLSIKKIGKIEREIIQKMINKTSLLIEDKKLRERMSKECIKTVKIGKFSIKERNKKLKRIYEEATLTNLI